MKTSNDWWWGFSAEEYEGRLVRVQEGMNEKGLDALLIHGAAIYFGTDPGAPNLAYLAGYAPALQGYLVVPRVGNPTLFVYVGNHKHNAEELSVISDVRAGSDLPQLVIQRLQELKFELNSIGVVGNFGWSNSSIPVEHYRAFEQAFLHSRIEIVTRWYEEARLVKSREEISVMEAAARVTDAAYEELKNSIRPGMTEMDLHNRILFYVHGQRARIPFGHVGITEMSDPTMRYPSFYPTNRPVSRGDVVFSEIAAGNHGYFGKIFGTIFVGEPTSRYAEMFQIGAGIHQAIYEAVKPGIRAGDIDGLLDGDAPRAGYRSISYISGWSTYNTPPAHSRPSGADRDMVLQEGQCLVVVAYIIDPNDERVGMWLGDTGVLSSKGLRTLHGYPVTDISQAIIDV